VYEGEGIHAVLEFEGSSSSDLAYRVLGGVPGMVNEWEESFYRE
jgi:hypothetical protein